MAKNPFQQLDVLRNVSLNGGKVTDCYRLMYKKELWIKAYQKLYFNKENHLHNESCEPIIDDIIKSLQLGSFRFSPTQKSLQKDKLMQEGISMILKAIYHPIFSKHSYGWQKRWNRHTALLHVKTSWQPLSWYLVGKLQPLDTQTNHSLLLQFLSNKINDRRFLLLIHNALKCGVMKREPLYKKHSNKESFPTLLMNIYLHEFDQFIDYQIKYSVNEIKKTTQTPERLTNIPSTRNNYTSQLENNNQIKETQAKIKYIRYLNHFVIGLAGNKEEASKFKEQVESFLHFKLAVELNKTNWLLSDLEKPIPFLGYELRKVKRKYSKYQAYESTMRIEIPLKVIKDFARKNNYGDIDEFRATTRTRLLNHSEESILMTYNQELGRIAKDYKWADNYSCLNRLFYLAERSFIQTLANKRKSTKRKVLVSLRTYSQGGLYLWHNDQHNREKVSRFIQLKDLPRYNR